MNKYNDKEEIKFLERVAFQVRRPKAMAKMHGALMPDGTLMDDIKSVNEFWDHVAHTDGLEIMNKAQGIVNTKKVDR